MIIGKDLYNSYYEEDEKLFSTGNEELDDILEEVYYSGIEDGYDYAQREFGEKKISDAEAAGKAVTKAGLATLGAGALVGGAGAAGLGMAAKRIGRSATGAVGAKSAARMAGASAAGAAGVKVGTKLGRAGLAITAAGLGTKLVGKAVRKNREKNNSN